jgi:hypothetical protein
LVNTRAVAQVSVRVTTARDPVSLTIENSDTVVEREEGEAGGWGLSEAWMNCPTAKSDLSSSPSPAKGTWVKLRVPLRRSHT